MKNANAWEECSDFMPSLLPIKINKTILEKVFEQAKQRNTWVLAFVVGTKPCFNKVYGAIQGCIKKKIPFFVIDSNQHHDALLTFGIREFGFTDHIAVNLQIRGDLIQKTGELSFKTAYIARYLQKNWPSIHVVPVVNGDTILCSTVPPAWMFTRREKSIQNEAGLRSMAPNIFKNLEQNISLKDFLEGQWHGAWHLSRSEPFPEQWDTFVSAAACEYHMAPTPLNKDHLIREGYPEDHIHITGAAVVDALKVKLKEKVKPSIFELYPELGEGQWIRMDIHRKENLSNKRFTAIFRAMENLVNQGHKINFILMNGTKKAILHWNLEKDLKELTKYPNFVCTDVWPAYAHVVEFYKSKNFQLAITDSGGVQEDMNIIGKPCVTIRFSTDRPETVMNNNGNILIPPYKEEFMTRMLHQIISEEKIRNTNKSTTSLYGNNTGNNFAEAVSYYALKNEKPFRWTNDHLNLTHHDDKDLDFF